MLFAFEIALTSRNLSYIFHIFLPVKKGPSALQRGTFQSPEINARKAREMKEKRNTPSYTTT